MKIQVLPFIGFIASILVAQESTLPKYLISNNGVSTFNFSAQSQTNKLQNYIALYDGAFNSSTLIGGYYNPDNDNAHCAMGNISKQAITLIIPENLTKFGMVNTVTCPCSITSPTDCQGKNSYCAVQCGAVIEEGSEINNEQGGTRTLHVSPLCQALGNYIISTFGDPSGPSGISEFVSCDGTEQDYCSVQFSPKSEFSLQINTNRLGFGSLFPGGCTLSGDNTTCTLLQSEKTNIPRCNLCIASTQNSACSTNVSAALTNWVQNNYSISAIQSGSLPLFSLLGYLQCPGNMPANVQQYLLDIYETEILEQENSVINQGLQKANLPIMPPVPPPTDPSAAQLAIIKNFYAYLCPSVPFESWNEFENFKSKCQHDSDYYKNAGKLFSHDIQLGNTYAEQQTQFLDADVSNGLPCIGTILQDSNQDPLIIYTCATKGFKPNYTCNFVYSVSNPGCAQAQQSSNATTNSCSMELISAYCNVPIELILNGTPNFGAFSCGFIGPAEAATVGANSAGVNIENNFARGAFYPFSTTSTPMPKTANGFVTSLEIT